MATPETESNLRQENGGKKMKKEWFLRAVSSIFLPPSFCLYLMARLALPPHFPFPIRACFGFRISDFIAPDCTRLHQIAVFLSKARGVAAEKWTGPWKADFIRTRK